MEAPYNAIENKRIKESNLPIELSNPTLLQTCGTHMPKNPNQVLYTNKPRSAGLVYI